MFQKAFLRINRAKRFRSGMIALCAIGAIVLAAVGPLPLLANPGTVTVRVNPATRAAPVNGTFTVDIVADVGAEMNPSGLGAYQFDLVYDPNYLEVISVSDAGGLGSTNRTVAALGPDISNPGGQTTFAAYSHPPLDVSGPGATVVLARVTLWAKRSTSVTTLSLQNALLTDTQANAWAGAQLNIQPGTIPLPMVVSADYDNDGKTDIAIFRPSTGVWYIRRSTDGSMFAMPWGGSTDVLVPGDYDGDGKTDIAIFRPSTGVWYIRRSTDGSMFAMPWGGSTDVTLWK